MDEEGRPLYMWRPSPAARLGDTETCDSFRFKCGSDDVIKCPVGCYAVTGPREMITGSTMCATCGTGMVDYDVQVACVCPVDSPAIDETWRCADKPYFDELTGSSTRFTIADDFCCDMKRFNDTPQGRQAWEWMGCPKDIRDCPRPSWHTSNLVRNMCVDANLTKMLITNVEVDLENTARDFRKPIG